MRSPCITTREKPSLAKIRENQCSKEDPPQLKINKSITFIKDLILNSSHMHSALKIHTFLGTFHFVLGYQFSSVAQLCPTLCNPMDCSTPGLPVYHQLPEFTQTHVYPVGDAIQPSHPLSSPSPPAFNLSQHQGLFN